MRFLSLDPAEEKTLLKVLDGIAFYRLDQLEKVVLANLRNRILTVQREGKDEKE